MTERVFDEISVGDHIPPLRYDVTATTVVLGALATRDWRPMHHDRDFAQNRNGTKDIFLNTPNQAAWFERYLTDWVGPKGRLGEVTFTMKGSIFPGDEMVFAGEVTHTSIDDLGAGWVTVDVVVTVDGDIKTMCRARVCVARDENDNPWSRTGDAWRPHEETTHA